jgi:hypothetical protein
MATYSKLVSLIAGVHETVNLAAAGNALQVTELQVGDTSPATLTKTILNNLISLQNGSDVSASLHHHDGRYYTESELGSSSASSGSDLIGDDNTYTNFTPAAATVKGALSAIDAALATAGGTEFADDVFRIKDNGDATKKLAFEVAAIATSTTRTITMPNANVDLGALTDSNISASAAISLSKLAALTASRLLVSDGSGVISASAVTSTEAGYLSGVTSAIQTQIDGKLSLSGGTMTGVINMGLNKITSLGAPTNANDAATKSYVDTLLAGLDFQPDVYDYVADASTTSPGTGLPAAATGQRYILASGTGSLHAGWGSISGVGNNDIVEYNGTTWFVAYDVSAAGEGALTWNRAADYFMLWSGSSWSEFGGLSGVTAGVGLSKSGNTLNVNLGAGIVELPSDEIGIDLYSTSGLMLTVDGTTSSTNTAAQLSLKLDGSTLSKSANGVKVADSGITATQLASDSVTTAKILDANVTANKLASDSVTTAKILDANVTANKLAADSVTTAKILDANVTEAKLSASVAGDGLTGGAGSPLAVGAGEGISVAANAVAVTHAPALKASLTAGESFAANTTFVVRYALSAETAGRVYKADKTSGSGQVYNAIGLAGSTSAVSAAGAIYVTAVGLYTLLASDTAFNAADVGKPVYLTTTGAFSITAPTGTGDAVTRIGMVAATNQIWVQPQFVGIA